MFLGETSQAPAPASLRCGLLSCFYVPTISLLELLDFTKKLAGFILGKQQICLILWRPLELQNLLLTLTCCSTYSTSEYFEKTFSFCELSYYWNSFISTIEPVSSVRLITV